jgi:hypothetical protein
MLRRFLDKDWQYLALHLYHHSRRSNCGMGL